MIACQIDLYGNVIARLSVQCCHPIYRFMSENFY